MSDSLTIPHNAYGSRLKITGQIKSVPTLSLEQYLCVCHEFEDSEFVRRQHRVPIQRFNSRTNNKGRMFPEVLSASGMTAKYYGQRKYHKSRSYTIYFPVPAVNTTEKQKRNP